MAALGKLGWLVAAALAVGWWSSVQDKTHVPADAQSPRIKTTPSATIVTDFEKPDAIAFPSNPKLEGELQWLYTTDSARVRAEPSTHAAIVHTTVAGERVQSNGRKGNWHSVTSGGGVGWIRGDLLQTAPPEPLLAHTPTPLASPAVDIKRAQPPRTQPARSGQPVREPYVGTCDCPYDRMRNGRRCGGNSAYSRPGGRSPICYL